MASAYVLMPFDPEFDQIYAQVLVPALEEAGYDVHRADDPANHQNILRDVIAGISVADLVVADLTALNPNVLYELGIAHTLAKRTVMLTQAIDDLPFDLRSYRVIPYSTDFRAIGDLQRRLTDTATKALAGLITFGNPVTDFSVTEGAPLPLTPGQSQRPADSAEHIAESAADEEDEEEGHLDFAVEMTQSLERLTELMQAVGERTTSMSERMEKRTREAEATTATGGPGATSRMRAITQALGNDLIRYGGELDPIATEMEQQWEHVLDRFTRWLPLATITAESDYQALGTLRSTTDTVKATLASTEESASGARQQLAQLRGISRDLNRGISRTQRALDAIIGSYRAGQSLLARMTRLIDERLANGQA